MQTEQRMKSLLERAEQHVTIGLNSIVDLSIPETLAISRATLAITAGFALISMAKSMATLVQQTGAIVSLMKENYARR